MRFGTWNVRSLYRSGFLAAEDGSSGNGMWRRELDQSGSGKGQMAGTCECGNEPSGSIKCGRGGGGIS